MKELLGYIAVFIAGVVLDEYFGARIVAKIKTELQGLESRLVAKLTTIKL